MDHFDQTDGRVIAQRTTQHERGDHRERALLSPAAAAPKRDKALEAQLKQRAPIVDALLAVQQAFAVAQAEEAIAQWILGDAPFTAKLHPEFAHYGDYDQLMRLQEWNGRQSISEEQA